MKKKLIKRFIITVASIVTLAWSAANAFALTNSEGVVSPFWQSDGSVYTFVAVSHASLDAMASTVGVVVNAIKTDTTSFGSTQFTITNNATTRIFIVATNHSTINSNTVTGANDLFISGTTNTATGHLSISPKSTTVTPGKGQAARSRDITQLSFWGAVVVPGTNTGFAMEFIGDIHDSLYSIQSNVGSTNAVGLK
jgi:hypothetical protein